MKNDNKKLISHKFATVQLPRIEERIGKDWVLFGGDNLFPLFLVELMNKSSMNRRCIQAKSDAVFGKGLTTGHEDTEYLLAKANPHESWNDVFEKVTLDYVLFGGYAINVIWSKDGESCLLH